MEKIENLLHLLKPIEGKSNPILQKQPQEITFIMLIVVMRHARQIE